MYVSLRSLAAALGVTVLSAPAAHAQATLNLDVDFEFPALVLLRCVDDITLQLDSDTLLAAADVVSLHVPLTDGTRHLIDADRIGRMKPGAILVNAARGGVVDELAVAAALKDGRLGGAALDVFETEPLAAEAARAFDGAPNLILTPHIAGVTVESNTRVSDLIADRVLAHLAG